MNSGILLFATKAKGGAPGQAKMELIVNLMHQLIWPFVMAVIRLDHDSVKSYVNKWVVAR
jgi:hypothetical protein